jgi:hypothetical protein
LFLSLNCLDLHRSFGASIERQRLALMGAYKLMNHNIEELHNIELTNGALSVISKFLFLHVPRVAGSNCNGCTNEVLYLIVSLLDILASRSALSSFISEVFKIKVTQQHQQSSSLSSSSSNIHSSGSNSDGGMYFIQCMLRLLDRFESIMTTSLTAASDQHDKNKYPSKSMATRDIITSDDDKNPIQEQIHESIHGICNILISLTRSLEVRTILHQHCDYVKELLHLSSACTDNFVEKTNYNNGAKDNNKLHAECRSCRLRILCTLLKYSTNEQREILYQYDGVLDTLLRFCNFDLMYTIRQLAIWCIVELTNTPNICLAMAKNSNVLGTLIRLILIEEKSNLAPQSLSPLTVSTNTTNTTVSARESALTALQNIAFDRSNRLHMIQFKNGLVLEALKKSLTSDDDSKSRRRAAGTVVNLVGDNTAELMVNCKGLLDTLAFVATQDENIDVQTRAALSLTKLAVHIADLRTQQHDTKASNTYLSVLDALVVTSLNKAQCSRVTAAIRSIARNHPERRPLLARHDGIVDTLTDILQIPISDVDENQKTSIENDNFSSGKTCKSNVSDRTNAIHAIAHLVNSDDATRTLLCNRSTVLTAIVLATQSLDTQDMAIRVLERFATVMSNRHTMAHCNGLIIAVAEAVERENHREKYHTTKDNLSYPKSPLLDNRYDDQNENDDDKCSDDGKNTPKGSTTYYLAKPLLMSLLVAM